MKKLFTFLSIIAISGFSKSLFAQNFSVTQDTFRFTAPMTVTSEHDDIVLSHNVNIKWRVASTDFPADWIDNGLGTSNTTFCDNGGCYATSIVTSGSTQTAAYTTTNLDFHMQINLGGATTKTGSHYMRVKFMNSGDTTIPVYETYIVTYPTLVPNIKNDDNVSVYPNPATNTVNVMFDASLDVKNVAIYNIIGKLVTIYKVNGNSASMNIDNLNSGIYYLRLISNTGEILQTKKFTKQ